MLRVNSFAPMSENLVLSPPTGIHHSVSDQALWGKHPAGRLLRLSPSVDAVGKIPNHCRVSSPKSKAELSRRFLGFDLCVLCIQHARSPWISWVGGGDWKADGITLGSP